MVIGDPLGAIIVDPNVGLLAFLSRFDLLEFNNLPMGHFYHFGASYSRFFCFSVPTEGLHSWRGVFLGNILLELLCVVLISLKSTSLDSLPTKKLLEWKRVV